MRADADDEISCHAVQTVDKILNKISKLMHNCEHASDKIIQRICCLRAGRHVRAISSRSKALVLLQRNASGLHTCRIMMETWSEALSLTLMTFEVPNAEG